MTDWRFIERVNVRRLGSSFIGEARFHAHFAVGDICTDPAEAMESARAKLDAELRPKHERWSKDDFEDLL